MKALILYNEVIQLEKSEFPVSSPLIWMDAPKNCDLGWIVEDNSLVPPSPNSFYYEEYYKNREEEYPHISEQLDDLFHNGAFSKEMTEKIQKVKTKWPKDNSGPIN